MRGDALFVGRERELRQLLRALGFARRGRGRIVLIGGEPGIGKSRLAHELAAAVEARGVPVRWGRSFDGPSPPYWPWAQIAGTAAEHRKSAARRNRSDPSQGPLHTLLAAARTSSSTRAPLEAPSDMVRVFNTVRRVLERASRYAPLLLILEDIHWADRNSLLVLELVTQELPALPVLLVATYRDSEVRRPLAQTLGELARLGAWRLMLGGISQPDTRRLLRMIAGRPATAGVVRTVHARTGGNPFFVTEIGRLPASAGTLVPANVRDAISRRLTPLSRLSRQMLVVASVIGREFDFQLLSAILRDTGEERLLRGLDEALEAHIIEPLPRRGNEWYQFGHELIREALYTTASPSRRARWHAAAVSALESVHGQRLQLYAEELAFHAAAAEQHVGAERVVRYAVLAGEQKLAAHAYEEALPHFERAWIACGAAPGEVDMAAIHVGLGRAQAATALRWNREQGWSHLRRAIDAYLTAGQIGRAVATATHPSIVPEGVSGAASVLERILADVDTGSMDEGWLRARLGAALYFETGDYASARAAFDRALKIAASHRSAALELRTLAYETSVDHFGLQWTDVLPKSRRVLTLARRIDDLHSETYARYRAAFVLIHTGRVEEARVEVDANVAAAERLRDPGLLSDALYGASCLAQLTGRWSEARSHSDRGLALAPQHLPLLYGRVLLEYETGHEKEGGQYLHRLIDVDRQAGPYPLASAFTAIALARIQAMSSAALRVDDARSAVRAVLSRRASIANAVFTARMARAFLAIQGGRAHECDAELDFLAPLEAVVPTQWCASTGRLLGLLARTAGQARRAQDHFARALEFCRQSGYRPELGWTCLAGAGALLDGGAHNDRMLAARLVEEAAQIADALGMPPLARGVETFLARHSAKLLRKPAGLTGRELDVLRLLVAGRSNKEIAQVLGISANTVAVHVARVIAKTAAPNRTGAAAYAVKHGLV